MKDYYEVRNWLESFIPQVYTRGELGLLRIENLLAKLGNPERKFKSVHVAGTSGKGSTAFYISKLLESFGYKTGLHVSPHLVDIRERMTINGKLIPIKQCIGLANDIKAVVDDIKSKQPELTPSYFEILTAMSFLHFAREKVDFAVVEVGLGGRLDATNVLVPEVSVITNIGFDHTEILGNTISKIAKEKAGIIKAGIPVVCGASGVALKVIEKTAKMKNAPLITLDTHANKNDPKVDVQVDNKLYYDIERYTENNFAYFSKKLAFLAVLAIKNREEKSPQKDQIKEAFSAEFSGRFEEIETGVILDAAHNPDKIRFLIKGMSLLRTQRQSLVIVVGFKSGKNWKKMLDILIKNLPIKSMVATEYMAATDTGFGSAVAAEEIAKYINDKYQMINTKCIRNSQKAVFEAVSDKKTDEIALVTGSLYLVGEARTLWKLPEF